MISDYARENTAFLLSGDASVVHLQASLLIGITDPGGSRSRRPSMSLRPCSAWFVA